MGGNSLDDKRINRSKAEVRSRPLRYAIYIWGAGRGGLLLRLLVRPVYGVFGRVGGAMSSSGAASIASASIMVATR